MNLRGRGGRVLVPTNVSHVRRLGAVVAAVGLSIAVVGCASDGQSASDSVVATSGQQGDDELVAPLVGGGEFSLSTELGSKPVALWFWAPG